MSEITYLRTGRMRRATGTVIDQDENTRMIKVKPIRADWKSVWLTQDEIEAAPTKTSMKATPSENQAFRVWWIPQVPMDPFHVAVDSIRQARKILDVLAAYDLFQLENDVKPDFCNAGGLEVFEDGEWIEWESADGDSIDSVDLGNAIGEATSPEPL